MISQRLYFEIQFYFTSDNKKNCTKYSLYHKIVTYLTMEHYVKSVRIRSFSGPYFPAFGLNTDFYSVNLRIKSECEKMRSRKSPNTDTFQSVEALLHHM